MEWGKREEGKGGKILPMYHLETQTVFLNTPLYQMHLEQVLYATNSVVWKRGTPVKKQTLVHEEMPYATTSDESNGPMSVRRKYEYSFFFYS